jgi:hypothetical protein
LETSAIGRAIGALGIGLGKSMASKQEVNSAKARQVEPTTVNEEVDPWAIPGENYPTVPTCLHGSMRRKTGLKKDGKPYGGYVCTVGGTDESCAAKWDKS